MSTTPDDYRPAGALARYWEDKRQPLLMLAAAAVAVLVVVLFMSVTGGEDEDTTWDASPNVTPCSNYSDIMNDAQRTDIASKMLHAVRAKDALSPPTDALVGAYAAALEETCSAGPDLRMDEAGASLYMTERATFGRP